LKLKGRSAIITGASQGFGAAIARAFVQEGAHVVLTARSADKLAEVASDLRHGAGDQTVEVVPCDVSVPQEVDRLMEASVAALGGIDILVNNASVFGPMGNLVDMPWDDWVSAITTNLLGTVYACRAAIPDLRRSDRGKIINISGGGAVRALPALSAYAASKAAVVRFTETLAEELRFDGIDVNSVAPGPLNTRFVDLAIAAGPERLGNALYNEILRIRETGGTPFELAADLCVYLASRQSDKVTGNLISARYDSWSTLHERIEELDTTNVYKLRRVDETKNN
jgi:NAD(P)-dependent dehydrogenase (short-subunit alcohol dehydrogenase family)